MPFALSGGATLATVAAEAKAHRYSPHTYVAKRWTVDDHVAMDWILQAREGGFDVGMPRNFRGRDKDWGKNRR